MQKVLIASSNPWSFALAVERAIAAEHRADIVDVLDFYRVCSRFSPHWRQVDRVAERMNRKFTRFVQPTVSGRDITADIARALAPAAVPPLLEHTHQLRPYRLGEARIGLAVLSSVTSVTTIQDPLDLAEYGPALNAAWRSAHLSEQIGRIVAGMGYDAIYLFNGRLCYSRPFSDIAEQNVPVWRFEQGGVGNRYIISDEGVHCPSAVARLIATHDFDAGEGESFFTERLSKAPGNPVQFFTALQRAGELPSGLDPARTVTFFSSSSDEMYAVTDKVGFGEFANQAAIVRALAEICALRGDQLVVRLHPHLQYKHQSWRREWDFAALKRCGVIVLQPSDATDSYALVRFSRCVLSCGSTVGFEAAYLGVPSADIGEWAGGAIGAVTTIVDAAGLARFVAAPKLQPAARDIAIRYGSYARRAGRLLPELDVGPHPYKARIDGRIVDPVRGVLHGLRAPFARSSALLSPSGGKLVVEPSVVKSLAKSLR